MALVHFGKYLRSLRTQPDGRTWTQREVVAQLNDMGIVVSQSLVNKYERGQVRDPAPEVLLGLSRIYGSDYMELVLRLVRDKYRVSTEPASSPDQRLYDGRLKVCEQALKRFETIGGIKDIGSVLELEILQLEAKARLIGGAELLDVKGLARWERDFPDLKKFWVAALQYVDNDAPEVEDAVVANLERGTIYTFFIPESEVGRRRTFTNLRARLIQRVGKQKVDKQLVAIPLNKEQMRTLGVDYAIANPLVHPMSSAYGFQCIRQPSNNQPDFAFPIAPKALPGIIEVLAEYAECYMNLDAKLRLIDEEYSEEVVKSALRLVVNNVH